MTRWSSGQLVVGSERGVLLPDLAQRDLRVVPDVAVALDDLRGLDGGEEPAIVGDPRQPSSALPGFSPLPCRATMLRYGGVPPSGISRE
jgi:hypothetical protein